MSKTSLRSKIRNILLNEDEKALVESGITYKSGALTKEGRKVVLDHIFKNEQSVRTAMVEVAKQLVKDQSK